MSQDFQRMVENAVTSAKADHSKIQNDPAFYAAKAFLRSVLKATVYILDRKVVAIKGDLIAEVKL